MEDVLGKKNPVTYLPYWSPAMVLWNSKVAPAGIAVPITEVMVKTPPPSLLTTVLFLMPL